MAKKVQKRKGQRNFVGDYETLLKAVQFDYACCGRFEASGYSEFAGKLYTMNPSMFQSPTYCDRTLTQMIVHYLRWFQDPNLRLIVGEGASWREEWNAKAQRVDDVLFVTEVHGAAPVRVGDQVVRVNGMTLTDVRPEVERTLCTTVEPLDVEREDWSVVLTFAKRLTLRDADGTERVVKTSEPAEGAVEAAAAARPAPTCVLDASGDVAVLTLRDLSSSAFAQAAQRALPGARAAKRLVIDVRGAQGGSQEDIYPLVELVLGPGATWTPAQLFGPAGIVMNYSRHNVDAQLNELAALRAPVAKAVAAEDAAAATATADAEASCEGGASPQADGVTQAEGADSACEAMSHAATPVSAATSAQAALSEASATLADIDAMVDELRAKRGAGFVHEMTRAEDGYYADVVFAASADAPKERSVVVLVDRHTRDGAEWLARAAQAAGFARVAGRATAGSLDTACPRIVRLDEDFSLVVPTAVHLAVYEGGSTLGRGIVPDVHVAWTPEHLERDVDLERARELASS